MSNMSTINETIYICYFTYKEQLCLNLASPWAKPGKKMLFKTGIGCSAREKTKIHCISKWGVIYQYEIDKILI